MKRQTSGTSSDIWQRITISGTTNDNEGQQMTSSGTKNDNEWYSKWHRTTANYNEQQKMTMSNNEWQRVIKRMNTNESK